MSALDPYIGAIKGIALLAVVAGLLWTGHHFGAQGVQADWNKDIADRAKAEKAAVLARMSENQGIFRQQEITNQNITKAHNDELAKVRADLSRAPRLRIGSAICGGSARPAQTPGASSGNAADTTGRLVREDVGRDIDALKLTVEEALATGRACQAFVTANGMTP